MGYIFIYGAPLGPYGAHWAHMGPIGPPDGLQKSIFDINRSWIAPWQKPLPDSESA